VTVIESADLSAVERRALLDLARAAIGERLHRDGRLAATVAGLRITPALARPAALFVTLKQADPAAGGRSVLRGCIGVLEATRPLYSEVVETAPKAAFEDPRFPPLAPAELDAVTMGLSVLTPPRRLHGPGEIVVGRDGVQLVRGSARSVFLPQVALEQGWDRERLLAHLSRKAGLADQDWRSAELFAFRTESFGETDQLPGG